MIKVSLRLVSALLCAAALILPASADSDTPSSGAERRLGGDLFIGGGSVTVREPVTGDLFASGGTVDVDAGVGGDTIAMGGKVRIGADVGQSVYAAGGQLTVTGKIGRNARMAGGQVELGAKSEILGNASLAGGQLRLHGAVRGHLQAAGGRVLIDGPVGGDVIATSNEVELGPNARIGGKLRYRSGEPLRRDPAAQVAGGVEQLMPRLGGRGAASAPEGRPRPERDARAAALGGAWTVGLVLLAAVLVGALPTFSGQVAQTLRERPGMSLLLGFVLLVCLPVAALLLLFTVVGIPLALLAIALYLALLPVAYVWAAIGAGDWALLRWLPERAARKFWRIVAAGAALVALALIGLVPWLGGLVAFAALLAGMGALMLQARRLA